MPDHVNAALILAVPPSLTTTTTGSAAMPPGDEFHRILLPHNRDEYEKVEASREIWGREARVLAGGVCVQAYPGPHEPGSSAYSFGCAIMPKSKFGFRNGRPVLREVYWTPDMPGVEEREDGKFAAIPILWCRR